MASTFVHTIAIVGGGFCGTVLAANLLRSSPGKTMRVVLIERSTDVGSGVAFASHEFQYLLNVPAGRMSATSGAPAEFLEFAQKRFPDATPDDFLPRALYGEYLRDLLLRAQREADEVSLERWHGEVVAVRRVGDSQRLIVVLDGGYSL